MVTVTTQPESREDALIRLADQARASGVKLFQDPKDGRFFATSRSQPGTFHRLSGFSCSCQGFIRHGRCAHLAALHSALGWLDTEPTPPASALLPDSGKTSPTCSTCGECGGLGEVQDLEVRQHGRFVMHWARCTSCHGTGKRTAAAA